MLYGFRVVGCVVVFLLSGCGGRGDSIVTGPDPLPPIVVAPLPSGSPSEMIRVPAGDFLMGSDHGEDEDRPQHPVYLDVFFVDRYEVTVAAYEECVRAGVCAEPATGEDCNWGRGDREAHPVNCVSWYDAAQFCRWAGKRLPTEAEWEKAARGTDGRRYPWGDEQADCTRAVMDDGGDGCGRESTWPVGSKPEGASPYGVMDLSGNVWEWTADWYAYDFYAGSPAVDPFNSTPETEPRQPGWATGKVLRGGSWADQTSLIHRAANRLGYPPETWGDYTVGFRCARD